MTQECLSTFPPSNDHRLCLYESIYAMELGIFQGRLGEGTSMGICPWLPIIALMGTNHNLSGHLSSVAQWGPQTRWSPQVYKFSCLNLIHNFVHILFLRDNFNYIQKSEKANESWLLLPLSRFSHVRLYATP